MPDRLRRAALVLALLGLTGRVTAADEAPEVFQVEDPARLGRPSIIVAPEYPGEALARGQTGYVDLIGHVTPLRSFADVEYRPGPRAEIFVEPLKQVMGHWEFYPPMQNDCFPSNEGVTVRVWFEIEGEKPKISVTAKSSPPKEARLGVLHREDPRYPRKGIYAGLMAIAYARSELNPDGSVANVEVEVYPRRSLDNLPFEAEVKRSLALWKYAPAPEGMTRRRLACYDIIFRLH